MMQYIVKPLSFPVPMKNRIIFHLVSVLLGVNVFQAWADDSGEGVTVKDNKAYVVRGDRLEVVTQLLNFPFEVQINTNGVFQVANGKERNLKPGQILRRDGWLLNPDGSAAPVFNHLAMQFGNVVLVRDGQLEPLAKPMRFPNKLFVNPDGTCVYPDGSRTRLMDGQLFRLDGTAVPAKDVVTFKNGRVVVQKGGKLISLAPTQIMGMNDGSRLQGDGSIQQRDLTWTKLREGQTVLIDGPLVNR